AAGVGIALALVLGGIAALAPRWIAVPVDRFLEVLFAFPALLLALLLIAITGPSAGTAIFAVGLGTAPGYARMVRGQILAAKGSAYVEAATALGHSRGRIVRAHILPNALSFLGLGVAPPPPEWGAMLDAGRAYVTVAGWLILVPGFVIVAVALAATTLGRHLQAHLEKEEQR
ncbi:ABC transporter permease, partial [Rubellimicrobium arenae]|uniref:ABC transporter permease n=1 Tax=Rubellimicrobium arenae TaxID=2817372 RepID=UPI001B300BD0